MKTLLFVVFIYFGLKSTLSIKLPVTDIDVDLTRLKQKLVEDIHKDIVLRSKEDLDLLERKPNKMGLVTPIRRPRKKKVKRTTTTTTKATEATKKEAIRNFDRAGEANEANKAKDDDDDEESEVDEAVLSIDRVGKTIKDTEAKAVKSNASKQSVRALKWAKHVQRYGKPVEIFYRRQMKEIDDAEKRRRHILLCIDLLRPVLSGMKKNISSTKVLGHQTPNRLIQLLSYGGGGQTAEDIESILYQINSLQLRFFQWDVSSIKRLFNFIMPGQKHSFKSMKYGVKRIFALWHMDLSNTNILIKDSRMFRPPCVGTIDGSTRSSIGIRYTKPQTAKTTCAPKDKACRMGEDYSSIED